MKLSGRSTPIWSGREPLSATRGQYTFLVMLGAVLGFSLGMTVAWQAGLVTGLLIGAYVAFRGRDDFRKGFWMRVYLDRLEWRDGVGEHRLRLTTIIRIEEASFMGMYAYTKDGKQHSMPVCSGYWVEGYKVIYAMHPDLFVREPHEAQ